MEQIKKTVADWFRGDDDPGKPSFKSVYRGACALNLPRINSQIFYITEAQYEAAKERRGRKVVDITIARDLKGENG